MGVPKSLAISAAEAVAGRLSKRGVRMVQAQAMCTRSQGGAGKRMPSQCAQRSETLQKESKKVPRFQTCQSHLLFFLLPIIIIIIIIIWRREGKTSKLSFRSH